MITGKIKASFLSAANLSRIMCAAVISSFTCYKDIHFQRFSFTLAFT